MLLDSISIQKTAVGYNSLNRKHISRMYNPPVAGMIKFVFSSQRLSSGRCNPAMATV